MTLLLVPELPIPSNPHWFASALLIWSSISGVCLSAESLVHVVCHPECRRSPQRVHRSHAWVFAGWVQVPFLPPNQYMSNEMPHVDPSRFCSSVGPSLSFANNSVTNPGGGGVSDRWQLKLHSLSIYTSYLIFFPDVKGACSSSLECRSSPLMQFSQSSLLMHRRSYIQSPFCTEHNVRECLLHVSQVGIVSHCS